MAVEQQHTFPTTLMSRCKLPAAHDCSVELFWGEILVNCKELRLLLNPSLLKTLYFILKIFNRNTILFHF